MSPKPHIMLILTLLLLVACRHEERIDFIPGEIYSVRTTMGDGFAIFLQNPDHQWRGTLYLDQGELMAAKRSVELKTGDNLTLVDSTGKEIFISDYSRYEEPEFKDHPETWTYNDSAYTVIEKTIRYGHARGYWASYPDTGGNYMAIYDKKRQELDDGEKELELTMDVYLPNDNRDASRPLLVLIHGGAFFNGDKTDHGFPKWAHHFANHGYVVASVNYRLGFKLGIDLEASKESVKRAGIRAVQDVDAAIRYMIHHPDTFLVDPNRVFVAGTSAGGITALNVAFMEDKDIPSEARDLGDIKAVNPEMKESYSIRAVGNLWGAVNNLSMLNNNPITSVISVQSKHDPVVPFDKGHPFSKYFIINLLFPEMYGSKQITSHLNHLDKKRTDYVYFDEKGHELHYDRGTKGHDKLNSRFYKIESALQKFFSEKMLPAPIITKHDRFLHQFSVTSSDIDSIYWRVNGGVIKNNDKKNSIDVLLFPEAISHSVIVCGKYKNGLTFRHEWSL